MKHRDGYLFWNAEAGRIGIRFEDGGEDDGLHCGTVLQAFVTSRELMGERDYLRMAGKWLDTRLEADEAGEWFLVGVHSPGQIPERQRVRIAV
jgi:hypothetical protein